MHRSLLVGCGHRGSRHAGALARSEAFEFAAACDIDRERAAATAEEHGVPAVFTDIGEALSTVQPAHVSCVFPPTVRLDVYRDVLGYEPASLVVEKPVANTRSEAERFLELAEETATTVTVCHQHIYTAEAAALKRWLEDGRLGEPERVTATSRGYLLSNGTHLLHMLDWLLGATPDRVRGFAEGPELMDERHTAEPEGALLAADYDGTRAYVEAGEHAPAVPGEESRWLETRVDIVGTRGRAEMVTTDHATLLAGEREHVDAEDAASDWFGDRAWEKWDYLEGYATDEFYAEQARALAGDTTHPGGLARAVAAQRTVEAGLRAAVEGRGVDPDTEPPAVGVPTERRLRNWLYSRRPHVVDARALDGPLETALASLAARGHDHVAVPADSADTPAMDEHRLAVPVVTVEAGGDVAGGAEVARGLDATLLVEGVGVPAERPAWLGAVGEDTRLALAPGEPAGSDALAELAALGAGVCLSPPGVLAAGDSPAAALSRLGEDVAVLRLRDAVPCAGEAVRGGADEAADTVPGGGGGVDFRALLREAVAESPRAHWLHSAGDADALGRSVRYVEARRPTGYSTR